jgi:hypothetical protein
MQLRSITTTEREREVTQPRTEKEKVIQNNWEKKKKNRKDKVQNYVLSMKQLHQSRSKDKERSTEYIFPYRTCSKN